MTGAPPRTRKLEPQDLDPAQRELYDAIVGGPRAQQTGSVPIVDSLGRLEGPFNAFLLQPAVGLPLQALGAALRYSTALPGRSRELAILVVAAHEAAPFERFVHEPIARSLGLTAAQLAGIGTGEYDLLPPAEALVARAVHRMVRGDDLDDDEFVTLQEQLGQEQLFELTTLVGYYSLLALQLRVFHVALPDTQALPSEV